MYAKIAETKTCLKDKYLNENYRIIIIFCYRAYFVFFIFMTLYRAEIFHQKDEKEQSKMPNWIFSVSHFIKVGFS